MFLLFLLVHMLFLYALCIFALRTLLFLLHPFFIPLGLFRPLFIIFLFLWHSLFLLRCQIFFYNVNFLILYIAAGCLALYTVRSQGALHVL
jgi:hypothetical protein